MFYIDLHQWQQKEAMHSSTSQAELESADTYFQLEFA